MKPLLKTLIIVIAFNLAVNDLLSQGMYINFSGGYGLPMNSHNLSDFGFYHFSGDANSLFVEQIKLSLGKGSNFEGAMGYMFNDNFATELAFSYLLGGKTTANQRNFVTITDSYGQYTFFEYADKDIWSNMFRINPSIIFSSSLGLIKPYVKLGLIIGMGNVLLNDDLKVTMENSSTVVYEASYKTRLNGGIAIGLNGGVGSISRLSDKVALFVEVKTVSMAYSPEKGEIYEAKANKNNVLNSMSTFEKKIEFVDSYTVFIDDVQDSSKPQQLLKQRIPFGSFGMNLGIQFSL